MLTGQLQPTSGDIMLEGHNIVGSEPHEIGRRGVGIKNQVPVIMNGLAVRENLWLAARARHKGAKAAAAAAAVAERLGLGPILGRIVGELAHGQRQWVEIAMVIVCDPKIILLDEPAAGMSDEETGRTAALIRELNKDATIVVVEHDMQFIRQIAHTVTVFHQGRILVEDSFANVIANPVVRDVYLGRQGVA
jgi:branched-chain amino acid transport system ATP-binding protein/urea transport system ATP-binding protein